jgi:ferredoxin
MRVIVDQDACVSSGQCVLTVPAVFDQNDDGVVMLWANAHQPSCTMVSARLPRSARRWRSG